MDKMRRKLFKIEFCNRPRLLELFLVSPQSSRYWRSTVVLFGEVYIIITYLSHTCLMFSLEPFSRGSVSLHALHVSTDFLATSRGWSV